MLVFQTQPVQPIAPGVLKILVPSQKREYAREPAGSPKGGEFASSSASITVGDRRITVVKPARAEHDQLVPLAVLPFDQRFSRDVDFYLDVGGGKNAIGNRYERFGQFIAQHDSIEAAEVHVGPEGRVGFTNGRHRYAWLRDHGLTSIPVAMTPESVRNARKYGYLAAVKMAWDESQHPRDDKGWFTNKSKYTPDYDAPEKGTFEWPAGKPPPNVMVWPDPVWKQQHQRLVAAALQSWVGDPGNFHIHSRDAREGAPIPQSGSGKQMRAEAEALLWELEHNSIPIPITLYRGSGPKGDIRGGAFSWSEDRKIAAEFAKRYGGKVEVLSANTARGLRLRDYTGDAFGEMQWVVRAGNDPRTLKGEHSYGNTQIQIAPHSSAALSLNMARDAIRDDHRMGDGKDVDPNHITVRYGLLNEDLNALRSFLARQEPFKAELGRVELFPASEHSDGAVPVVARIVSPELEAIEAEIGEYADFKEKSFPDYKPHCTLAYVRPDMAPYYAGLIVHGSFLVQSITISHQSGVLETIPFGMTQKWDVVEKRQGKLWDESKHPRNPGGSSAGGEFTSVLHSPRDAMKSLLNEDKDVSIDRNDVRRFLEYSAELPEWENPDLTNLQVEGMEIFGGNGLGIERKDMPQIPVEHRQKLLEFMESQGVKITEEQVDPLTLKPTQKEISARNVGQKLAKYDKGKRKFPNILVSKDNRILDGHHHWGMMAAFALEFPDAKVPIFRIQTSTKRALVLMQTYMRDHGLKRKSITGEEIDEGTFKWDETQHPRDKEGQFAIKPVAITENLAAHPGMEMVSVKDLERFRTEDRRTQPKSSMNITEPTEILLPRLTQELREGAAIQEPLEIAYDTEDGTALLMDGNTRLAAIADAGFTHAPVKISRQALSGFGQPVKKLTPAEAGINPYRNWLLPSEVGFHTLPKKVKKADPISGRYVTPFVSFDKQGDDALRMIASLNSSRLATWGFTAEAEVLGAARYKLTAVLDGRTSKFCRMMDGREFDVDDARRKVIEALNVQDPEDLRQVQPWPKQTRAAMAGYAGMSEEEFVERGLHIPPYHPHCRTLLRHVPSSEGKATEPPVATVPVETEVFHAVTADDLRELGIDPTPENVAQWNEHIGMTPVELLTRLTGMTPQEIMTKGQGVGARPVRFEDNGSIGIRAVGEATNGMEFKVGALLDPFTGIFYLTEAAMLAGTPKAELAFLKNLFNELINTSLKTTATELAVGVAGNAAYFAKLGFLPDDLEWDSIRLFAQTEIETGKLKSLVESLNPEDQLLVKQLLQDTSPSALSALVELPFFYEGKSLGEWLLGEVGGAWSLDLMDDMLVSQAKAYLS